ERPVPREGVRHQPFLSRGFTTGHTIRPEDAWSRYGPTQWVTGSPRNSSAETPSPPTRSERCGSNASRNARVPGCVPGARDRAHDLTVDVLCRLTHPERAITE